VIGMTLLVIRTLLARGYGWAGVGLGLGVGSGGQATAGGEW